MKKLDGVKRDNMKKDLILTSVLGIIGISLIMAFKGFSYPLLPLFVLFFILTYISIEDWKTGLISITLNVLTFICGGIYAFFEGVDIKTVGINLLVFVLPFILIETIFQLFINRGKDEERFLVGGGDMILFGTMSLVLTFPEMVIMLFVSCLMSLITSKIINKSLVHFAPFIQIGFLVAFLFGVKLLEIWINFNNSLY